MVRTMGFIVYIQDRFGNEQRQYVKNDKELIELQQKVSEEGSRIDRMA